MDWSSVTSIDSSGQEIIEHVHSEAEKYDIVLLHAELKGYLSNKLKQGGVIAKLKSEHFFWQLHDAVLFASKLVVDDKKRNAQEEKEGVEQKSTSFGKEELKGKLDEMEIDLTGEDSETPHRDYTPLIFAETADLEPKSKCTIF